MSSRTVEDLLVLVAFLLALLVSMVAGYLGHEVVGLLTDLIALFTGGYLFLVVAAYFSGDEDPLSLVVSALGSDDS